MATTISLTEVKSLGLSTDESPIAVTLTETPPSAPAKLTPTLSISPPSTNILEGIVDTAVLDMAATILHIIDRYRLRKSKGTSEKEDEGRLKFLTLIYTHVKAGQPVPMCLPAFPFKSPNATLKVLGTLPDKAEEFALAHLNGLCEAIGDVYPPGAQLTIISDGLVYNDLLGVPDRDVWAYGETLRALASAKDLKHISFSRLRDLVSLPLPDELDEMTYVANASNFRRALLNDFSDPSWEWQEVRQNEDVCLTYRGYIKFLETDLQYVYPQGPTRSKSKYKKGIEYIAKQMLARGHAFASAVQQKYTDHVRLSIHASTGASKLSVSLLPTDSFYTTPWHCTVALLLDGTLLSGMRADFEKDDRFELVLENGRPAYFREKSDLLTWGQEKGGITVEPVYPSGYIIRPANTARGAMTMADIDTAKVRALAEIVSPVVLRGFAPGGPDRDLFVKTAERFGTPTPWKFGLVLEVKDRGADARGLNNVLSAEWMPFHFDGLFKTKTHINEQGEEYLLPDPPKFQFFAGVTTSPKDTGFTVFAPSTLIFKHLPPWLTFDQLKPLTWAVSTSSFNQTRMAGLPLIVPHPTTGKPCLRFHEPWPQSKTQFEATNITIDGHEEDQGSTGEAICAALASIMHDRRVAYYHAWEKGDLLVSDNVMAMHTRSDFTAGCDRELWRIHFD